MTGTRSAFPHHGQPLCATAAVLRNPGTSARSRHKRLREAAGIALTMLLCTVPAHAAKHGKLKTKGGHLAADSQTLHRQDAKEHDAEARSGLKAHRAEAKEHQRLYGKHTAAPVHRHSTTVLHAAHVSTAAPRHPHEVASAAGTDSSTDRATEDRVHAWYEQHHEASPAVSESRPATRAARAATPAPDLSPEPRTATVEDFDRAAEQQARTLRAAAARTTAADDAASAEATHIPSTAPTERVPAPFQYGPATAPAPNGAPRRSPAAAPAADAQAGPRANQSTGVAVPASEQAPESQAAVEAHNPPNDDADDGSSVSYAPGQSAPVHPAVKHAVAVEVADDDADAALAASPAAPVKVDIYDPRGRLLFVPPMKGSHEILVHQNQMAMADGLERIEDDGQLAEMRRNRTLAALPDTQAIYPDERLPMNRRYARPWTVRFLNDLARAHYARFGTPIVVTSAVRTVDFQRHLVRINGNAAPPTGDVASPHLYGQAVDIAKHGMSTTEIMWMRAYLTPVESSGKLDVEEEFQQSCFHISVYRRYLGLPTRKDAEPVQPVPSRPLLQAKVVVPARHHHHLSAAVLAAGLR